MRDRGEPWRAAGAWAGLTLAGWGASLLLAEAITGVGLLIVAAGWYVAGLLLASRLSARAFGGRWVAALLLGTTFPAWMWVWVMIAGDVAWLVTLVPSVVTGLVLAWVTGWWRWGGMVAVALLACGAAVLVARVHGEAWRWVSVPHAAWNAVVSAGLAGWAVWARDVGRAQRAEPA